MARFGSKKRAKVDRDEDYVLPSIATASSQSRRGNIAKRRKVRGGRGSPSSAAQKTFTNHLTGSHTLPDTSEDGVHRLIVCLKLPKPETLVEADVELVEAEVEYPENQQVFGSKIVEHSSEKLIVSLALDPLVLNMIFQPPGYMGDGVLAGESGISFTSSWDKTDI